MHRLFHQCILMTCMAAFVLSALYGQVAAAASEHAVMLICGVDSDRIVLFDVGDEPNDIAAHDCCGDCTGFDTLRTAEIQLTARFHAAHPAPAQSADHLHHPGAPTWPGAPPQGPPAARS